MYLIPMQSNASKRALSCEDVEDIFTKYFPRHSCFYHLDLGQNHQNTLPFLGWNTPFLGFEHKTPLSLSPLFNVGKKHA